MYRLEIYEQGKLINECLFELYSVDDIHYPNAHQQ